MLKDRSARWGDLRRIATLSSIICVLIAIPARAYDFVPTEPEFRAWPDWCRNLYVSTQAGAMSEFAQQVDPAAAAAARRDDDGGYWHYCAGIALLSRAQIEPDVDKARFDFNQAISEVMFNYARGATSHKLRGEMNTTLGLAYRGLKDWNRSIQYLRQSISESPAYIPAYSALGLVLRDRGDLVGAKEVLAKGIDAAQGNSAELHYFLGLVCFDLGDIVSAREQARLAYDEGYPLPGLRKKIEAASKSAARE